MSGNIAVKDKCIHGAAGLTVEGTQLMMAAVSRMFTITVLH